MLTMREMDTVIGRNSDIQEDIYKNCLKIQTPWLWKQVWKSNVNHLSFLFGTQVILYVLKCLVVSHADDGDWIEPKISCHKTSINTIVSQEFPVLLYIYLYICIYIFVYMYICI